MLHRKLHPAGLDVPPRSSMSNTGVDTGSRYPTGGADGTGGSSTVENSIEYNVRSHGESQSSQEPYVLLQLKNIKTRLKCLICTANGIKTKRVRTACIGCGKGFHVNCFSSYNFPEIVHNLADLQEVVEKCEEYSCSKSKALELSNFVSLHTYNHE